MTSITITTYAELSDFVDAFRRGHINMLIVCSRGGLGKTQEAKRVLVDVDPVVIRGHVTPLGFYGLLYRGRGRPVLVNETDDLLRVPANVGLLKQLCETEEVKTIAWTSSDRRAAEIDGGLGCFQTTSHVLILCNSFVALDANVAALKTRATVVEFVPSSSEILTKIKTFATDMEIVAFLEECHESLPQFNLRTYWLLAELKRANLEWRKYAINGTGVPAKVREIADLLGRFDTDSKRIEHYSGCRRDFYNWKPEAVAYARRCAVVVPGEDGA